MYPLPREELRPPPQTLLSQRLLLLWGLLGAVEERMREEEVQEEVQEEELQEEQP